MIAISFICLDVATSFICPSSSSIKKSDLVTGLAEETTALWQLRSTGWAESNAELWTWTSAFLDHKFQWPSISSRLETKQVSILLTDLESELSKSQKVAKFNTDLNEADSSCTKNCQIVLNSSLTLVTSILTVRVIDITAPQLVSTNSGEEVDAIIEDAW